MVNRGRPSRDCLPCRKRKLRCDLRPDGCGQCYRAGLACSGYRSQEELLFRDQTQSVTRKVRSAQRHAQAAAYHEIKLENDALLPQTVHVGWDVLAKHDFFTNFVFGLARSYDALGILYQTATPPDYLAASVEAASLAFFALRQFVPPKAIMKLATERYVDALQLVNAALANPASALADSTLQAILLLDLYEKLVNRKRASTTSWMRHMNGAVSLIRARGESNLQTYVGRRLTQRLYTTLLISCAISGMRIPDKLERLRIELNPYFKVEDDPKWAVTTLNEKIINFNWEVRTGQISCADKISMRALEYVQIADAIENSLSPLWHSRRVPVGNDALGQQLTMAGSYDIYQSLYFTQVRNVIRTIRLNLSCMIERYATFKTPELLVSTQKSIEKDSQAICDSLTQYLVRRDEEGSLWWDLAEPMQQLGCYTIFFPLYLAAQASRDPQLCEWVRKVLGMTADVGGIAMAQRTADALKQGAQVPAWDVYTMLGSYAIAA
ncbi:hypothetical protein NLG97_g10495 [Lecanicillium saksenae]|uniref:Uncharacterized protein n=1 Tax=Lecanicillium saksenae TaxID=468837 RepID=A0ACC1QEZ9_9HYPO|nr:hypothetical protein NLG97_g10495 [Lecanicillium saksenae]